MAAGEAANKEREAREAQEEERRKSFEVARETSVQQHGDSITAKEVSPLYLPYISLISRLRDRGA